MASLSQDIYVETLAVFDEGERRHEPLTTPEVAEALDENRRTVYKRLQKLVEGGKLETKETGANSRVWWRPASSETAPSDVAYHEIFEMIPDGVLLHRPSDGTIIDVNEQFCEMLGYAREELLDRGFEEIHADVPPYTLERGKRYVERAATDGPQTFEWLDETKEGEQIPVEVHLRQRTIDGEDCILGVVRDITERKERERERRETAQQLQGILDTVEAAIFLKDTDGRYLLMNQTCRELVGVEDGEEVVGLTDDDLFPEDVATQYRRDDERVFETNETIEIEEEIPTPDGIKTSLTRKTPLFDDDGEPYAVCGVSTDITDRKEREQQLRASRQFNEELVENAPFGMIRLDEAFRISYENPRAEEIIGLPDKKEQSDGIGIDIRKLPSIAQNDNADTFTRLRDGETVEFEFPFESIYGNEVYFTGRGVPLYRDGEFDGAVLMATDISERRERERELRASQQFNEELVENAPFGMFRLDENLRITYENPRAKEIIGLPDDREESDAIGVDITEFPPIVETGQAEMFTRLKDGETIEFDFAFESIYGEEAYFSGRGVPLYRDGEFDGAVLMAADISEQKERERQLRASQQFNEELVENAPFGMFRLDEDLRITYENPRAEEIIGLPDDMEESAGIGVDIRKLPSIVETGQAEMFTRLKEGETVEFEFPFESIYGTEAYFTGRCVPLYRDGEFDGAVLMATDISERRAHERELERQRERLAALDELNSVVREITDAVIDKSTRDRIEQVVCARLAESDSYRSAWVCGVGSRLRLHARTAAGVEGLPDEIASAVTLTDPTEHGPVGTAVRTQDVQSVQNVLENPTAGLWAEYGRTYGFQSAAAIPIVHQGILYGVLGVCSERPEAFTQEERAVVGQLGEVIGHAIAAVNRKRALMSDDVVELELRIPEFLNSRNIDVTTDGTITVERTVPLGDEEYLLYGTATDDAMAVVHALSETLPDWKRAHPIDETNGDVRFEQHLSNPPIVSTVADHGGYVERGRIEDGEYSATIHFPPRTDIRRVVADIRETYPNVQTVSQMQVTRNESSSPQLLSVLSERLTDRQRAALEAGYYAGFFDWPRDSSGEEVAWSLDISSSTFHQHVRKAEKKLLDVVFGEP